MALSCATHYSVVAAATEVTMNTRQREEGGAACTTTEAPKLVAHPIPSPDLATHGEDDVNLRGGDICSCLDNFFACLACCCR